MEIIQRIRFLIEEKYGERGETSFSKVIGIPQVTLNNYIKERRGLSYEVLNAILSAFPEISAEWLLRGEGEMLKSGNTEPVALESIVYKELYEDAMQEIKMLNRKIGALECEISMMNEKTPPKEWRDNVKHTGTVG